jgi:hypothetical protein
VRIVIREVSVGIIDIQIAISRAGLTEDRPGQSPRGHFKTETEFTVYTYIQTFASLKSRRAYIFNHSEN